MPYYDSIGMPAGYKNNSPYGPLQVEDLHGDAVLYEAVENPVADAEMTPVDPMFETQEQGMAPPPGMLMGPETAQFNAPMGGMPTGWTPTEGMPMGGMPMEGMPMEGVPVDAMPGGQMGPEMGQMAAEMGQMGQMGQMGPEMGQMDEGEMDPQMAGLLLRERLKRRQERMADMSMRFAGNAHELNR